MDSRTPIKCQGCPVCIYPYRYTVDRCNRRLPKEDWLPTCRMNLSKGFVEGMYGDCFPDQCEGPEGRRYIVTYENNGWTIKFID